MTGGDVGFTEFPSEPNGYGVTSTQHGFPEDGAAGVDPDAVCAHVSGAADALDGFAATVDPARRATVSNSVTARGADNAAEP